MYLLFIFNDCIQVAAAPTLKDRIPGYGVGGVREGQGGRSCLGSQECIGGRRVIPFCNRLTSNTQMRVSTRLPTLWRRWCVCVCVCACVCVCVDANSWRWLQGRRTRILNVPLRPLELRTCNGRCFYLVLIFFCFLFFCFCILAFLWGLWLAFLWCLKGLSRESGTCNGRCSSLSSEISLQTKRQVDR